MIEVKLKIEEISTFANELNQYLKLEFKHKKDSINFKNHNVFANHYDYDIMIRFFSYYPSKYYNSITISRISFTEEKKGHATRLIEYLVSQSDKYCYDYIIIESTNRSSQAFVEKLGFKKIILDDDNMLDYVISVTDLKKNLYI